MKLLLCEANLAHVHKIAADLSDISKAELLATFGTRTWWPAIRAIKDFMAAGAAVTLLGGDTPIAVFGHMPHSQDAGARVTWFLASHTYFGLGARGVLFTRRYLAGLQQKHGMTRFFTYSLSPHPEVNRWFRAIGYRALAEYTLVGGGRAFILDTKARPVARDAAAPA